MHDGGRRLHSPAARWRLRDRRGQTTRLEPLHERHEAVRRQRHARSRLVDGPVARPARCASAHGRGTRPTRYRPVLWGRPVHDPDGPADLRRGHGGRSRSTDARGGAAGRDGRGGHQHSFRRSGRDAGGLDHGAGGRLRAHRQHAARRCRQDRTRAGRAPRGPGRRGVHRHQLVAAPPRGNAGARVAPWPPGGAAILPGRGRHVAGACRLRAARSHRRGPLPLRGGLRGARVVGSRHGPWNEPRSSSAGSLRRIRRSRW